LASIVLMYVPCILYSLLSRCFTDCVFYWVVISIIFVTLANYKVQTPWRRCRCTETRRRAYDIYSIINIYVVHLLVWIIKR